MANRKIVLITQKTDLDELIIRYNTISQAKFYIESHGGDFSYYLDSHNAYKAAADRILKELEGEYRVQVTSREHVPNFMFGGDDIAVAVGRDGLIANVLKYLDGQPLLGVNPDPKRIDGILLPFAAGDIKKVLPEVAKRKRSFKSVTFAQAALGDGQSLLAVNDLFIGRRTHASAKYEIEVGGERENQSSSGMIVSTGMGATGWLKGILAGARGIGKFFGTDISPDISKGFSWDSRNLFYTVREPFQSKFTSADIVFGSISGGETITVRSRMPESGVIFSDGIEEDFLEFNSGAQATISISEKQGNLVF